MNITKKEILKNKKFWVIICMFIAITTTGIIFGQKWYRILPLYISLFVMMMQAKANRYGYIIGGLNAVLYAIVNVSLKLYAAAVSAFFFSFPMQIFTFILWNKRAYKQSTEFRKFSKKQSIIFYALLVIVWIIAFFATENSDSPYRILDNTSSILGIAVTIICLFSFIEYTYLQLVSSVLTIFLYIQMITDNPAQITYLIYSCYSFACVFMGTKYVRKLYKEQNQSEKQKEQHQKKESVKND